MKGARQEEAGALLAMKKGQGAWGRGQGCKAAAKGYTVCFKEEGKRKGQAGIA